MSFLSILVLGEADPLIKCHPFIRRLLRGRLLHSKRFMLKTLSGVHRSTDNHSLQTLSHRPRIQPTPVQRRAQNVYERWWRDYVRVSGCTCALLLLTLSNVNNHLRGGCKIRYHDIQALVSDTLVVDEVPRTLGWNKCQIVKASLTYCSCTCVGIRPWRVEPSSLIEFTTSRIETLPTRRSCAISLETFTQPKTRSSERFLKLHGLTRPMSHGIHL